MRGISGSGKSTWVTKHYPDAVVVSADDFFRQPDGSYQFDAARLQEAHEECMRSFLEVIMARKPLVIVDNTNVTAAEISPYVLPAKALGYDVEVLTLAVQPETAIGRKDWVAPLKVKARPRCLQSKKSVFQSI